MNELKYIYGWTKSPTHDIWFTSFVSQGEIIEDNCSTETGTLAEWGMIGKVISVKDKAKHIHVYQYSMALSKYMSHISLQSLKELCLNIRRG